MTSGEGSGWHRESRRHSEAAKKSRPTHAPVRSSSKKEIKFSKSNPLSEAEIRLMMKRINASPRDQYGNVTDPEAKELISKAWDNDEGGWELTKDQNAKGLASIRKHKSQLGWREQDIMDRDPEIRLLGVYDDHKIIGGRHFGTYYPYYIVRARKKGGEYSNSNNFEYAYIGGKMEIMG